MAPRLCSCHWLLLSSVLWNVAAFPSSSSSSSSSFSANRKRKGSLNIYRKYHPGIAICNCIFSDLLSASVLFVPKPQFHFVFCILYFFSRLPSLPLSVLHLCVYVCVCWHLLTFNKLSKVSPVFCARKSPGYCSLCSLQICVFLVSFSSSSFCCYMLFSSWLLRPSVCRLFLFDWLLLLLVNGRIIGRHVFSASLFPSGNLISQRNCYYYYYY